MPGWGRHDDRVATVVPLEVAIPAGADQVLWDPGAIQAAWDEMVQGALTWLQSFLTPIAAEALPLQHHLPYPQAETGIFRVDIETDPIAVPVGKARINVVGGFPQRDAGAAIKRLIARKDGLDAPPVGPRAPELDVDLVTYKEP